MGEAVLSENVKYQIQRYSEDTLTSIVQLDHVGDLLHSDVYKATSNKLAAYLSGTVMQKKEKAFYESLKWYEKLGFINSSKQAAYEKSVDTAGKTTALAVNLATTAVPYIKDAISSRMSKLNYEKFFMSWIGYINHGTEVTPIMISNVQSIMLAGGIQLSHEAVAAGIKAGQVTSSLPHLNKGNMTAINASGIENMNSIAKMVVSTADLENGRVKDRALEFLEDVFYIPYQEANQKLDDIMYAQDYLSRFVTFSAFDYLTFFQEFISSSSEAAKIGSYDVGMDVYTQRRIKNKESVIAIAKDSAKIGAKVAAAIATENPLPLIGCAKPTADIVKVSEGLMSSTLNPKNDPSVGKKLLTTIIKQRKEFDLKKEDDS
ncbi:MAG: hypothetical protein ACI4JM_07425 [Oscillospiraceae bacterium]